MEVSLVPGIRVAPTGLHAAVVSLNPAPVEHTSAGLCFSRAMSSVKSPKRS